jgi:pimeloyl-ACP methyl ester carboxylesterase
MAMSPPKADYEYPPVPLAASLSVTTASTGYASSVPEMYVVPGVVVIERFFTVPLDYLNESRGTIQIYARHCVSMARQKQMEQMPYIVYLQGGASLSIHANLPGPGMESSSQPPSNSGMLKVLMDKGYQVLQLDQRGTGLSTPISGATLHDRGSVEDQVRYLKMFRADNIGTHGSR